MPSGVLKHRVSTIRLNHHTLPGEAPFSSLDASLTQASGYAALAKARTDVLVSCLVTASIFTSDLRIRYSQLLLYVENPLWRKNM